MKALLLIESDRLADIARFYLKPLGFEVIRYRNPVKAIDNIGEINPDAVLVSARDFPRHWKVLTQMLRAEKAKLLGYPTFAHWIDAFPLEEAAKAAFLGVNGVVKDELDDRREQGRFQQLLKRYIVIDEDRAADRIMPSAWDRLDFIFAHPLSLAPISGRLEAIYKRLAEQYDQRLKMRRLFLAAIAWPMIQLVLAIGVIGLLIWIMGARSVRAIGTA